MGERKVVSKYIPADFDPALIPRGKKLSSKDGTVPVRMMLPFSIQCSTCKSFLYRGRKFNSKKETTKESYLGIKIFRFYIKCSSCSRPITFLTDPQNGDYAMESGGTRNYEIQRDAKQQEEAEEEQVEDPMKTLENRVLESQREMADMENLERIQVMNAQHVKLLRDPVKLHDDDDDGEKSLNSDDEQLVQSIQFGKVENKRLDEQDEAKLDEERKRSMEEMEAKMAASTSQSILPVVITKKKRRKVEPKPDTQQKAKPALAGLLSGYGSSSSDDE